MNAQNRWFIFPTIMVLTLNSYLHCTITLSEATDFPAPFVKGFCCWLQAFNGVEEVKARMGEGGREEEVASKKTPN